LPARHPPEASRRLELTGTERRRDRTEQLDQLLPADAGRADYERIVVVSRETLVAARRDIPER